MTRHRTFFALFAMLAACAAPPAEVDAAPAAEPAPNTDNHHQETAMSTVQTNLKSYLESINGTNDWSAVQPHFEAVMHDEVIIVAADGEKDRSQWQAAVQGLLDKGAIIRDVTMVDGADESFHYQMTMTIGDKEMKPASKATIKDGMLVRVEPVDPAQYAEMAAQ